MSFIKQSDITTHVLDNGVHLTATQNTLIDGITASATEINYTVGVTSAIQTQLDGKSGTAHNHSGVYEPANANLQTTVTNYTNHAADSTIHFTKSSILFNDLSDVVLTTPTNTQILQFNGTNWVNVASSSVGQTDHTLLTNIGTNAHSVIDSHLASTSNPHSTTKAQVGLTNVTDDAQLKIAANLSDLNNVTTAKTNLSLQNVDNTSDANKPISTATQTALDLKDSITEYTGTTTNATQTVLGSLAITSGTSVVFTLRGVGRNDTTGDTYSTVVQGCIKNQAGATGLVGALSSVVFNDTALASADITLTANDTTDVLEVKVTGIAATTIDWKTTLVKTIV